MSKGMIENWSKEEVMNYINGHSSRSLLRFSVEYGLSRSTLYYWLRGDTSLKLSSADKVIEVLAKKGHNIYLYSVKPT